MRLYISLLVLLAKLLEVQSSARLRMVFTETDKRLRRIRLPIRIHQSHVQLVEDGNNRVIMNAGRQLYSLDFVEGRCQTHLLKSGCEGASQQNRSCNYNITVLHKRSGTNQVFLCQTNETETTCCNKELPSPPAECTPSPSLQGIVDTIKVYRLKAGEPSVFIASTESEELYVTQSSTENPIGIYKFGSHQVRPTMPDSAMPSVEHQYLGLVDSRSRDKTQNKLYAFFKEKNTAEDFESDLWLPFVAQVCMADKGGTKSKLQYQWTSHLKARLFCGDRVSGQHYPELVDVAFHGKEDDAVSRVYALFRNEWGMSAVCVYSINNIEKVFETSAFKGNKESIPIPRPGTCTQGQDNDMKRLTFVQSHPEMEKRVFSMNDTDPLLVSHHHYTHILLDAVHNESDHHTLLYLSLENGKVHKVLDKKTEAFIIAEYSPFKHRTHILDMILHAPKRKLYVSSSEEVVQVDVQRCGEYGQRCEDCVLARDPYCGWDGTRCVTATGQTLQDVEKGNPAICQSGKQSSQSTNQDQSHAAVPLRSRYFLRCPVTSQHAEYTWHGPRTTTACRTTEPECVLLIDSMSPEDEGVYRCTAEERGYTGTIVNLDLQISGARPVTSAPLAHVYTVALVSSVLSWR